ncbi:hypothetical protein [[Clostridium] aminophilum]|uniref:Uncharacterized protein n=1 Tax=[Clostridium] aminophilum TaxID=1526 RepID=A0A1I6JZ60_9FIRM|nr:hypothetical protein [[Clostridium] aminophilum]SFR84243.1 hypothetical protein SAMN02910262_02110 [[Clostridium] aminophilum]
MLKISLETDKKRLYGMFNEGEKGAILCLPFHDVRPALRVSDGVKFSPFYIYFSEKKIFFK